MKENREEIIFYLGIEIIQMLILSKKPIWWLKENLYIDLYYKEVRKLYKDYKQYDNKNKSLLQNIHDYIDENEQKILDKIITAFYN